MDEFYQIYILAHIKNIESNKKKTNQNSYNLLWFILREGVKSGWEWQGQLGSLDWTS